MTAFAKHSVSDLFAIDDIRNVFDDEGGKHEIYSNVRT